MLKPHKVILIRSQPDDCYIVKQIEGQITISSGGQQTHRAGDHITEAQATELSYIYSVTVKDH